MLNETGASKGWAQGVKTIFLATVCACLSLAALASDERSSGSRHENPAGISKSPAAEHQEFICHKDHAGLSLAAAEPLASAEARLRAAIAEGGGFVVVDIEDLECAYCAAAIERAFSARPEIAAAYVNTRNGSLSFVTEQGEALEDGVIRKLIKRRGYSVAAIRRDASLELTALPSAEAAKPKQPKQ